MLFNKFVKSTTGISIIPFWARKTTSTEVVNSVFLNVSLTIRFNWFLFVASLMFFFETIIPSLDWGPSLNFPSIKCFFDWCLNLLFSKTAWNSEDFSKRFAFVEKVFDKSYAESLFLPFALLRLRTALPPAVAIRALKPCVRFLLRLLGWNVLFITIHPYEILREFNKNLQIIQCFTKFNKLVHNLLLSGQNSFFYP